MAMEETMQTERVVAVADRDVTNLESQLNSVDSGLSRLEDVLARARQQLAPLARPAESGASLKDGNPEPMLSSTASRIRTQANQAHRLASDFIELLDCLDV